MNKWLSFLVLALCAVPVLANTGAPMVAITLPMMILLLVPIILIEGVIVKRDLCITWKQSFRVVTVANLITTFIGLPLSNIVSWLLAIIAKFAVPNSSFVTHRTVLKATLGSYWFDDHFFTFTADGKLVRPFPNEPAWYFVVALSIAWSINLIASFYLEYMHMRRHIEAPKSSLWRTSLKANSASYLFLLVITMLVAYKKSLGH
jgi:hypothetical protein